LLCDDGNANGIQKENQKEQQVWLQTRRQETLMAKRGLYANINARKKAGTSRSKKNSTITPKAYANMKAGFPKKKKK